ncbi:MAG: DUF4124 domain-containing protein [Candidatus Accumulibacter sp.]|nr:DUF4124 domain-containing protein [Accumulibacter sp.]
MIGLEGMERGMRDKRFSILCFLLFFGVSGTEAQIQVYRWKDKDGRIVVGDAPPENNPSVEKITVKEPPPPSRPAASRRQPSSGAGWKESDFRGRLEAEANAERNREKKQRACADARARKAYVDSIRDRAVWKTDPATGEQTLVSDEDRAAMESEVSNAIQKGDCETQ